MEFTYPDIHRKSPPEQDPESLLEKLGFHYLGGEETDSLIRNILYTSSEYSNAKERNKALKQALRDAFHLVPRKIPHWAQSTHDPEQAYLYSDKILALHAGRVLSWGIPQEVMTESLVSTLYGVDVEVCSMHDDRIRVCVPEDINK